MSTEQPTEEPDEITFRVRAIFHNDEVILERIAHGLTPAIVLRPTLADDCGVDVKVDVTGPETPEDVADFLECVAQTIREAHTVAKPTAEQEQ